ncbi:AraC family transcriptional regulator [Sphingobium sp. AN558]|uniref:AraC family transcriptional regulator n=1 Tax=Sphingobium sp. AN558 TaxID=3133442 RepID=UPI0030BB9AC9
MGLRQIDRAEAAQPLVDSHGSLSFAVDAAQGPVRLRYFAPPDHLRPYIGSIYVFTVSSHGYSDVTRADVPQLRFMIEGSGHYHFHDGVVAATPEVCLLGPTMGATRFVLDGPAHVLGVSLLPAGWVALLGGDASMMADRLNDPVAQRGGERSQLLYELRTMTDVEAMVERSWAVLTEQIRLAPSIPQSVWQLLQAIDHWLTDEGSPRIEALVEATGLSARQLARLTNRYYGAPPKLLARKYRALRCSARIALDRENWQSLLEDGRFYDQSHLIREIKHFIGLTPHQLLTEPSAVALLTLLRRTLGADVAVLNRLS